MQKLSSTILLIIAAIITFITGNSTESAEKPAGEILAATVLSNLGNDYKEVTISFQSGQYTDKTYLYLKNVPITDKNGSPVEYEDVVAGSTLEIHYSGYFLETYPVQIDGVTSIVITEFGTSSLEFTDFSYQTSEYEDAFNFPYQPVSSEKELDKLINKYEGLAGLKEKIKADGGFSDDFVYILGGITEPSGTAKNWVEAVYTDENKLALNIESNIYFEGTDDMARWYIAVKIPKAELKNVDLSKIIIV